MFVLELEEQGFSQGLKFHEIVFGDRPRRDQDLSAGQLRFVATKIFVHADDGLPANLQRFLDNRAVNVAAGNPGQRVAVFVKANDLHLASAGSSIAAKMAMMAMTTSSSINVKACFVRIDKFIR